MNVSQLIIVASLLMQSAITSSFAAEGKVPGWRPIPDSELLTVEGERSAIRPSKGTYKELPNSRNLRKAERSTFPLAAESPKADNKLNLQFLENSRSKTLAVKNSSVTKFVVQFPATATGAADLPQHSELLALLKSATGQDLIHERTTRTGGQVVSAGKLLSNEEVQIALHRLRRVSGILWAELYVEPTAETTNWRAETNLKEGAVANEEMVSQVIIKMRSPIAARAAEHNEPLPLSDIRSLSEVAGIELKHVSAMSGGAHVYALPSSMPITAVRRIIDRLEFDSSVEYVDAVTIAQTNAVPNDPLYSSQWHYFEPTGGINAPRAWDISTGAANLTIAVIDTGALFGHPDLSGRLLPGYNMISDPSAARNGIGRSPDASDLGSWNTFGECPGGRPSSSTWHGTHVAGTIGAASNNGVGVAGINWNSKILPVRVLGKCGGTTADITDAIRWAAGLQVPGVPTNTSPAKIINLSLGGAGACPSAYQSAINDAISAGATIVASAGNDAVNVSNNTPANCNGVIAVAANTRLGDLAQYSNFGAGIAVSAPGGANSRGGEPKSDDVYSTRNSGTTTPLANTFEFSAGTSMAAPHVTGIASLLLSIVPGLTAATVKDGITANSRPFVYTTSCWQYGGCGLGIADAARTLLAATGPAIFFDAPGRIFDSNAQPILFYGSRLTGSSTSLTAQILNSGLQPLIINSITRSGPFNGTTNCIGATLVTGAACSLTISFLPTSIGDALGTISISSNAPGGTQTMLLAGIGISPNSPGVSASLSKIAFNPQYVGTTSVSQPITVTNTGATNLQISNVTVSPDFGGTTTCIGATIPAGGTCRIDPVFRPTSIGFKSGVVNISSNAPSSPFKIELSGLGVGAASVLFSPTTVNFGSQAIGTQGSPQAVTLTNNGSAGLQLTSASISGDFVFISSDCGDFVSVGGSCTASFAFAPTVAGTRTGAIVVASNAPASPHSVQFSGSGISNSAVVLAAPSDGATISGRAVTLQWNPFVGAGAYSIKVTDASTGTSSSFPLQTATSITITNLSLATTYRWTVAACTNSSADTLSNCANVSAPRTFTTLTPQLQLSRRGGIDVDGSGKSAILVRSASAQLQAGRLVNNSFQFTPTQDPGPAYRLVGVGDFFNSGRSDLAFQNMTQGTFGDIRIWRGFSPSNEVLWRQVKQVWDVQAGGDLDGDGFGDLVWRYVVTESPDTGVSYIWFTNGSSVTQVRKRGGAPLNWQLIGAADLNGDGAADMVYISPTNQARALMATPNRTCANVLIGNIASNLTALKLADFSGTGRGDILLRDASSGQVQLLSLDATNLSLPPYTGAPDDQNASCTASSLQMPTTAIQLGTTDPSWQFYAAGDFNGDGVMDIVWRRPDGTLVLWLNNRNGASPTIFTNAGQGPSGYTPVQP
ncbi:MAG: S8 family serine peptidase [Rhodocyclaceae bacterium]|nr:S8 family serine peptidase [Rhodocyclaceae bacterium]